MARHIVTRPAPAGNEQAQIVIELKAHSARVVRLLPRPDYPYILVSHPAENWQRLQLHARHEVERQRKFMFRMIFDCSPRLAAMAEWAVQK